MAPSEWALNKDNVYETLFKDHFTTAARDSRRLAMHGKISSVTALASLTSRSSTSVNAHASSSVNALAPCTTMRDSPATVDQQTLPGGGGAGEGGGEKSDIGGAPGIGGGEGGEGGEGEGEGGEGGRLWEKHRESILAVSHVVDAVSLPKPEP